MFILAYWVRGFIPRSRGLLLCDLCWEGRASVWKNVIEKNNLTQDSQEAKERQEGVRDKVSFKTMPPVTYFL